MSDLVPIVGSWICKRDDPDKIGVVLHVANRNGRTAIEADFGPFGRSWIAQHEWGSGLRPGFTVQDIPLSSVRRTLGTGTVVEIRELATREQALVQFHQSGKLIWLPFERLKRVKDPSLRFKRSEPIEDRAAERTSLNIIAQALKSWNEATGALDRLDVDPLPHQIALVHHIINSGQTNWLIADDVGLGKTIEVGLLMAGLERRETLRRILLVVPSGLTRQWKDEMLLKFDRRFLIYGVDFRVSDHKEWGLYERVIVSLDLAKPRSSDDDGADLDSNFGMLLAAGSWDIVIFDEAHRLARNDRGQSTLRFKLAQALRKKTDSLVLLSGTPHQGDNGKFRNLLSLVRPDLKPAIDQLEENSDVVREIVLRNRKIDTVDIEGNFLFKGVSVKRIEVSHDPAFAEMERELKTYLRTGYQAGEAMGGSEGRAIGFVMTIYRKLASSSVAALHMSLKRRLERIEEANGSETLNPSEDDDVDDDLSNRPATASPHQFFDGEIELIQRLLGKTTDCMRTDRKCQELVELINRLVNAEGEKVLIFTEYRATQAFILYMLRSVLKVEPLLIHGGHSADEKRDAVQRFEEDAQVLISTEAGGEGLNMHRSCHILINYDLPWNPSRISQRIGRLYRYGQMKKVIVFNFCARDTIDNEILGVLFDRLEAIVSAMSRVSTEFSDYDTYAAEVMGELLDRVDISLLLEEAKSGKIERPTERVDAALAEARKAKKMQDEVLLTMTDLELKNAITNSFTTEEVCSIIKRALPFFGIEFSSESGREKFVIRLPDQLKGEFPEFGTRTVIPVTTKRADWRPHTDVVLLDFSSSFVDFIVNSITSPEFEGGYGAFEDPSLPEFFAAFLARFQNDQGRTQSERLILVERGPDGRYSAANHLVKQLLNGTAAEGLPINKSPATKQTELGAARDRAEVLMAEDLSKFLHPNDLVLLAAAERNQSNGPKEVEDAGIETAASMPPV
ncbi:DEAD/DEAH box helicase [Rhodopseudomonas pseudopalustris]|uniref:SNF2 family N-terminal domain-containing protein n=1 Tax=Rhodopseudomonas pseudopalustris TaxID=1513892 RepID=A0A1H8NSD3_9BRAD|nr:DEAD/DEAH box helicase [Rhodopseudomonas pseudopalustris]SEO32293.1 SNF2 family N-terminal domain-containing protein [Rhodopseudomonas pseudopalustris]